MYIELSFLFLLYAFSTIALFVSIYALWTLKEVEEFYKKKNSKQNKAQSYYYSPPPTTKPKSKSHWG